MDSESSWDVRNSDPIADVLSTATTLRNRSLKQEPDVVLVKKDLDSSGNEFYREVHTGLPLKEVSHGEYEFDIY